ncbi:MAG: diaminopimelate dehydrogenase [Atopobiaceae bacterium]|nr:diaminopimelate dehydrogenase [Atopobiaceae bacterium]
MKVAIAGYGNLGRGVEAAVSAAPDMELSAIFTRRAPDSLKPATDCPVLPYSSIADHAAELDVVVLCGGSATDLPTQTPELASLVNVVDSFDTHAKIPEHFAAVDAAAQAAGTIGIISCGWDPGLFSLARVYAGAALPSGADYTFWGRGVSQGHSDAIRRIRGVVDARQYTVPVPQAMERVRAGEQPELSTRDKHTRECFVVAEEGADLAAIEEAIVTMPNYFADYDTTVTFISQEELNREHAGLPHGGSVIRSGALGLEGEFDTTIEFSLKLESNPYFTGSVLTAAARAAVRLFEDGQTGARTMLDIPPALLSPLSAEELRAHLL